MKSTEKQRLVMVGIRKKGENGFKLKSVFGNHDVSKGNSLCVTGRVSRARA